MGSAVNGIKRFILWDYPRAGWQYDVMVALILAFIFVTPRDWFRDQPKANSIVMLPSDHGNTVFWMDTEQLASVPEAARAEKAGSLLQTRTGKRYHVVRLEPIVDSEQEIKGFMAFTTP
ncbi:MAG TPA: hypothetical protein VMH80_08275 [Bryobacteraceae bacterium]|nr:hypothetical protein [Bryobacteraceae bacterium]